MKIPDRIESLLVDGLIDIAIYISHRGAVCSICLDNTGERHITGRGDTAQQAIDECENKLAGTNIIELH